MKQFAPLMILAMCVSACAQNVAPKTTSPILSWLPHPMIFGGPSLVGNGYQAAALDGGVGLLLNSNHLLTDIEARYMNARKIDDNTTNNNKGHERYLQGRLFYQFHSSLYLGGGAQWSETSTTNYTKKAWRTAFGVGGDIGEDHSMRWQTLYVLPGTDRSNGLQGPEIQLWFPSPASKRHLFYRQTLGIYEFHTTVTDPSNVISTAEQIGERHSSAFLDFTFGWRF